MGLPPTHTLPWKGEHLLRLGVMIVESRKMSPRAGALPRVGGGKRFRTCESPSHDYYTPNRASYTALFSECSRRWPKPPGPWSARHTGGQAPQLLANQLSCEGLAGTLSR